VKVEVIEHVMETGAVRDVAFELGLHLISGGREHVRETS
jgi:hypothetical protein